MTRSVRIRKSLALPKGNARDAKFKFTRFHPAYLYISCILLSGFYHLAEVISFCMDTAEL